MRDGENKYSSIIDTLEEARLGIYKNVIYLEDIPFELDYSWNGK